MCECDFCVFACPCVCVQMCVFVCEFTCVCMCTYACAGVCTEVCLAYVFAFLRMRVYKCECAPLCVNAHVHMCASVSAHMSFHVHERKYGHVCAWACVARVWLSMRVHANVHALYTCVQVCVTMHAYMNTWAPCTFVCRYVTKHLCVCTHAWAFLACLCSGVCPCSYVHTYMGTSPHVCASVCDCADVCVHPNMCTSHVCVQVCVTTYACVCTHGCLAHMCTGV